MDHQRRFKIFLVHSKHSSSVLADLSSCEGEVVVQGDEGPGVAKIVDCHGVAVGHQEREEEEEQQEVDGEKTLKERCACPWMG